MSRSVSLVAVRHLGAAGTDRPDVNGGAFAPVLPVQRFGDHGFAVFGDLDGEPRPVLFGHSATLQAVST